MSDTSVMQILFGSEPLLYVAIAGVFLGLLVVFILLSVVLDRVGDWWERPRTKAPRAAGLTRDRQTLDRVSRLGDSRRIS